MVVNGSRRAVTLCSRIAEGSCSKRKVETMPIPSFQTLPVCAVYLNKFVSLQRSANTSAQYLSQLYDTKRGFIEKIRQINQEIPHCSKACLLYTLRKHKVIIQRFTDNSNTLFRNTQMLLLVILLNKNVSHRFDVLVSVICPV